MDEYETQTKKKTNKDKYGYEEEEEVEQIAQEGDFVIEQEQDNEFMAVKPWLGAIK